MATYIAPDHITPKDLKKIAEWQKPTSVFDKPMPCTGKDPGTTRTDS